MQQRCHHSRGSEKKNESCNVQPVMHWASKAELDDGLELANIIIFDALPLQKQFQMQIFTAGNANANGPDSKSHQQRRFLRKSPLLNNKNKYTIKTWQKSKTSNPNVKVKGYKSKF